MNLSKTHSEQIPYSPHLRHTMASDRSTTRCRRCIVATQDPRRSDWTPSVVLPRPTYSYHSDVAILLASSCHQCSVIAKGALHFSHMYHLPEGGIDPKNISIECMGPIMKPFDFMSEENYGSTYPETEEGRMPEVLRVSLSFKNVAMPTIHLVSLASPGRSLQSQHLFTPSAH